MFKLDIAGYGTELIRFADTKLVLFVYNISDKDIPVGETINKIIKQDNVLDVSLEILYVSLGYGGLLEYLPKGYKCAITVKGSMNDIKKIKGIIPKTKGWTGKEEIIAIGN